MRFALLGKCDGSNPSSIALETIRDWEAEGLLEYLGAHQDVRSFIAQSACVVLPSYKEGVPRVLLEAMSMEKPIITTNVSGCKECILNPHESQGNFQIGSNGLLVPHKDPQALAQAIKYFLSLSEHERREMGRRGREYALDRFDISQTIQSYIQALNRHANPSKSPNGALALISNTSFGMHNFRLPVIKALQKLGYEIHIIAPKDSSTELLENEGCIYHPISLNPKGLNPLEDLLLLKQITKILKKIRPLLVFNYTIKPAIYGSIACKLLGLKNIAIITGLGYVFINAGFKKRVLKSLVCLLYRFALRDSREVWFLNQEDRETFLSHKILQAPKAKILDSEGVDTEFFSPPKREENSEEKGFLLIARMLWDKGVGEFVDAIRILKTPRPPSPKP